mgnify:CR=1 FL=1
MKLLKLAPILFIFFGNFSYKNLLHAEINNPTNYKALSNNSKKLSISNVEFYIKQGDDFIKNGDFDKWGSGPKDFLNKLRKGNKLTFGKETIEIEKFKAILYKSKEDAVNNKYTKI